MLRRGSNTCSNVYWTPTMWWDTVVNEIKSLTLWSSYILGKIILHMRTKILLVIKSKMIRSTMKDQSQGIKNEKRTILPNQLVRMTPTSIPSVSTKSFQGATCSPSLTTESGSTEVMCSGRQGQFRSIPRRVYNSDQQSSYQPLTTLYWSVYNSEINTNQHAQLQLTSYYSY